MGIKNFLKSIWYGDTKPVEEAKPLIGKSGIRYVLPLTETMRKVMIEGILEEFPSYHGELSKLNEMSDMQLIDLHEEAFRKGEEMIQNMLRRD